MKFVELLLRNHPLANILFAVVLFMGTLSYLQMPREQDPEINFNWVSIVTTLPGAAAEDVEKRVTQPLEDSLSGIEGINFMTSISRPEKSQITLTFRLNRDIEFAANDDLDDNNKDNPTNEGNNRNNANLRNDSDDGPFPNFH